MNTKKNYVGQIPFDREGNQLHYPESYGIRPSVMVDNFIFDDTLIFDTYARGRSAAYFQFTRKSSGKKVVVFLTDFETTMIPHLVRGEVSGLFTFCKRGQNFGCKRLEDSK